MHSLFILRFYFLVTSNFNDFISVCMVGLCACALAYGVWWPWYDMRAHFGHKQWLQWWCIFILMMCMCGLNQNGRERSHFTTLYSLIKTLNKNNSAVNTASEKREWANQFGFTLILIWFNFFWLFSLFDAYCPHNFILYGDCGRMYVACSRLHTINLFLCSFVCALVWWTGRFEIKT